MVRGRENLVFSVGVDWRGDKGDGGKNLGPFGQLRMLNEVPA